MKTARKIPKLNNIKPEFSIKGYFGRETISKASELHEYLDLPIFKRVQTGVNNRSLNWWTAENLLGQNFKEVKRYTFTEYVWIKMVERMRLFTLPLPLIALYREQLFKIVPLKGLIKPVRPEELFIKELDISEADKKHLLQMLNKEAGKLKNEQAGGCVLELMILESVMWHKQISLALFANGELIVIDPKQEAMYSDADKRLLETGDYLTVSVSSIITEFLRSDLALSVVPKIQLLSYPENKLYEVLQSGEYDSIAVKFEDKAVKPLELKKSEDTKRKIIAVLEQGEFEEITVKKNKGVVTKILSRHKVVL